MSFDNLALTAQRLAAGQRLEKKVYTVPAEINAAVARLKLRSIQDRRPHGRAKELSVLL